MSETAGLERNSLYNQISEIIGFTFSDEYDNHDQYKEELVSKFGDLSDEDFEDLPEEVVAWVNNATRTVKRNRTSETRKSLPRLEGLDEKASAEKKVRRVRVTSAKKRDGTSNFNYRISRIMADNPAMDDDAVAKACAEENYEYADIVVKRGAFAFRMTHKALVDAGKLKAPK